MDEETLPFGSRPYLIMLGLLLFGRAMDLFSTRVATPNLIHEANPIARRLGWGWGTLLNLAICFLLAFESSLAIVLTTISLLVAAHNFKNAWLMRTMGEDGYGLFMSEVMLRTSKRLFVFCLFGETGLTILVGLAITFFSFAQSIPEAIGIGITCYGLVVAFYTLLSVWRARHRMG